MGGLLQRVIGGAAKGYGDYLIGEATRAREDALAKLKRTQDLQDTASEQTARRGLLHDVVSDDKGNLTGITAGGVATPLGAGGKETKRTAPDNRTIEQNGFKVYQQFNSTTGGYDEVSREKIREPKDSPEPLVEIGDGKGGSKFVTRSEAIGKPGKGRDLSAQDVIAPILQKVAKGEKLTAGEDDAWNRYSKATLAQQVLSGGLGADNALLKPDAASPTSANAPPAAAPTRAGPPTLQKLPGSPLRRGGFGAGVGGTAAPAAPSDQAKPTAAQRGASLAPVSVPPELAKEPDGTIVEGDDGRRYEKRGSNLVPIGG